ncbi:MAG: DUF4132 domain-containing protein [Hymenobacter sp.]|nr:DUF4132 domain-containing protein [Hymenobacter sp.]
MASAASPKTHSFLQGTSPEATEMRPVLQQFLNEIKQLNLSYYSLKLTVVPAYQAIREQNAAYKGRLVLAAAEATHRSRTNPRDNYQIRSLVEALLQQLLRSTLELSPAELIRLFQHYGLDFASAQPDDIRTGFHLYPVWLTLGQVEKYAKKQGLGDELAIYLGQMLEATEGISGGYGAVSIVKIRMKIQEILGKGEGSDALPTVVFTDGDLFGRHLNQFVQGLDKAAPTTRPWLHLLQAWQKTSGGQPTAKLRKESAAAVVVIGPETVREKSRELLSVLASILVEARPQVVDYGNGRTYEYTEYVYLHESSLNVAKGLIWTLPPLADEPLLQLLTDFAAKCYRKIPGRGPLAAGLGNACLLVLSESGLPGVAHLSRLRPKIRQSNTQALIGRYVEQVSGELGVTPAEIEDMAVPDCGLQAGRVDYAYGDYRAVLQLLNGKAEVRWQKAGKPLKAAPTALKQTHAAELKELKNLQTQVQQTLTTQRDRLDRSFIDNRRLPFAWFRQYYFGHGLLSCLTRQLIWRFHRPDGSHTDTLWLDDAWRDAHQQPVSAPTDDAQVQLWHPVMAAPAEVLAWRALLEAAQLRQPLKQAFREVYLLTPPEERTATYSNRMAAHVLKQHQFNSLAKLRGWKYSLMGAYDKGYESDVATLELPAQGWRAEFWVSEVNADDAFNDTGIWHYVSTDQVRFTRLDGSDPLPLPEIPPLVFSEVMRDVDLFVGVASVANDPAWRDNGGLPQYRNYWESYSFGELGEVAKNRKLALERLVPRLKISKVSEIRDKFLVVKGKVRTYKIHLGSGNILMEPNDQYLCIVPDRSAKTIGTTDVFLPFEGDAVLSIILSKALLLMDDDKITDETILRQIKST